MCVPVHTQLRACAFMCSNMHKHTHTHTRTHTHTDTDMHESGQKYKSIE